MSQCTHTFAEAGRGGSEGEVEEVDGRNGARALLGAVPEVFEKDEFDRLPECRQ